MKQIKPEHDAFGQEMLAFFKGKKSYEIIERDDGFIDTSSGAPAYFKEYKNWPTIEKKAIKLAQGKILDIGAGAGRVSLYLQQQGGKVTAIDNSPLAIKVCTKRGVKKALVCPIEEIKKFPKTIFPNSFDSVVMFGNNFGLLGNVQKAKKILRVLHTITTKNAIMLAESCTPYETKDPIHLKYHERNRARGKMSGQLKIRVRFLNFIGDWFEYLLVSPPEMAKILEGTGWKIHRTIKSGALYVAVLVKRG